MFQRRIDRARNQLSKMNKQEYSPTPVSNRFLLTLSLIHTTVYFIGI